MGLAGTPAFWRHPLISTFIIENYFLVRLVLVIAAILFVVIAALLVRAGRRGKRIATVIAAVGVVAVLGLTLVPDTYPMAGVTCSFDPSEFYRDSFNVMLFLLPAIFAVIAVRHPLLVFASGVALSAVIEVIQALSPVLGRRCDIGDWLANSTGTAIGVLLAVGVIAVVGRISRRRAASETAGVSHR